MKPIKNTEKGQIVVLLVLVVIGLLGFTALAIDGSMIFSDRRFTQSVADSASLAGGNAVKDSFIVQGVDDIDFTCGSSDVLAAVVTGFNHALPRIDEYYPLPTTSINGGDLEFNSGIFTIPDVDLAGHQVWVSCNQDREALTVYVELTSQTDTAFAHLISDQIIRNTVEAETQIIAYQTLTGGNTIISLRQDCGNDGAGGILIKGSTTMTLLDGGTCSNSCLELQGAAGLWLDSDGPLTYDMDNDLSVGTNIDTSNVTFEAIDEDCTDTDPFEEMFNDLVSSCSSMDAGVMAWDKDLKLYTFFQGNYSAIPKISNEDAVFHPGLYCIDGDLDISGGIIIADNVTFVITDVNKGTTINGNSGTSFTADTDVDNDGNPDHQAPTGLCEETSNPSNTKAVNKDGTCDPGYKLQLEDSLAEPGILFYVDYPLDNKNLLTLVGNTDTTFEGIIYAPNTYVTLNGSATSTSVDFGVAVIGYDVILSGSTITEFSNYDEGVPAVSGWLDFLR